METKTAFNKYMDCYLDYPGLWESPSRCGLKLIRRKDGKTLAIATEIYRENPGTPVTEVVASIATLVFKQSACAPDQFLFIEHTPDLRSKLTFYGETFDFVTFDWDGEQFINPKWRRLTTQEVDEMMES
jgi:hypothetical protein